MWNVVRERNGKYCWKCQWCGRKTSIVKAVAHELIQHSMNCRESKINAAGKANERDNTIAVEFEDGTILSATFNGDT